MALLPVDEALERLVADAGPLPAETVPIAEAAGRVLAGPVAALRTQPPFDASAMDGYAVRADDIAAPPARLTLRGTAAAGHGYAGRVGEGEAVRIFTGAPLPEGADTIVIQEDTRALADDAVEVVKGVARGRHIRARGLDFHEGDALLDAGRVLDPVALSLAASANHPTLPVVRKPLVALVATGDELVRPGAAIGPDQIVASNIYGVAAIVEAAGGRVLDLGIARDSHDAVAGTIRRALGEGADLFVTIGGASVGDHDLVHTVLTAEGMTLGFWKIAMRPGKPLMFGRLGETRCIGLPGNPVASIVCSHLFVAPLVARLAGRPHRPDIREARLGAPMAANDHRQSYIRAKLEETAEGLTATPYGVQDSSMLRTLAESGGLVVRRPFDPSLKAGDTCRVLMLR